MLITAWPITLFMDFLGGKIPGRLFIASCLILFNRLVVVSDMIMKSRYKVV